MTTKVQQKWYSFCGIAGITSEGNGSDGTERCLSETKINVLQLPENLATSAREPEFYTSTSFVKCLERRQCCSWKMKS